MHIKMGAAARPFFSLHDYGKMKPLEVEEPENPRNSSTCSVLLAALLLLLLLGDFRKKKRCNNYKEEEGEKVGGVGNLTESR